MKCAERGGKAKRFLTRDPRALGLLVLAVARVLLSMKRKRTIYQSIYTLVVDLKYSGK